MRTRTARIAAAIALGAAPAAFAGSTATYELAPGADGRPGIRFEIPYTMGTHRGEATEAAGAVEVDVATNAVVSARFEVPIGSIRTGRAKMECHLRSSLGLDYAASAFPERHVCDADNRLPSSGPDAVVHPTIRFELASARVEGRLADVASGATVPVEAVGRFTIHGVTREGRIALTVERGEAARTLRVRGSADVALADYGIVVKPFLFVKVEDRAKAFLDLRLARVEGPAVP